MGHYELAQFADVYTQLMFTDVRSVAQIAPGGIFFDTSTINCDNPLLSASKRRRIGCDADRRSSGDHADGPVHRPSQRRRRRSSAGLPQLLVPRPDRHARRDRGRLGVRRRARSSRARRPRQRTLNYFSIPKISARAGCGHAIRRRRHRLPLGGRRHGSELRAVQRRSPSAASRTAALDYISGAGSAAGHRSTRT